MSGKTKPKLFIEEVREIDADLAADKLMERLAKASPRKKAR